MQNFEYLKPTTIEQAVAVLYREGDQAKPLSGGTDLIVQLREGRRSAKFVLDVKKIPELSQLTLNADGSVVIGAATPCHQIYGNAAIAAALPGLMDSCTLIGGTAIQGRASLGGNLCTASPAGDSIPSLIAHHAVCVIAGTGGWREVPVEAFCTAPGRNCLQRGEMLVSIKLPAMPAHSGGAYLRFIPRNEMDIAVASAGVTVTLDGDTITAARVAIGAVAPTPLLIDVAGAALVGRSIGDQDAIEACVAAAKAAAKPITDMRGTVEQRVHLVGVMVKRALAKAIERAQAKG
ncbi:MAG: xanthine dehydrogenase family protein subunit M [Anaerolineae bacterium]|nr:xanthine dehydrogenase family protein subunit M [Anaerolineae bacterium]